MKTAYRMFKRGGVFYAQNNETGQQQSLRTKDKREATKLVNARNGAAQSPALNREPGRVFLSAIDPAAVSRSCAFLGVLCFPMLINRLGGLAEPIGILKMAQNLDESEILGRVRRGLPQGF